MRTFRWPGPMRCSGCWVYAISLSLICTMLSAASSLARTWSPSTYSRIWPPWIPGKRRSFRRSRSGRQQIPGSRLPGHSGYPIDRDVSRVESASLGTEQQVPRVVKAQSAITVSGIKSTRRRNSQRHPILTAAICKNEVESVGLSYILFFFTTHTTVFRGAIASYNFLFAKEHLSMFRALCNISVYFGGGHI